MVRLSHLPNSSSLNIFWQLEHGLLNASFALQIFSLLRPMPWNWDRVSISLQIKYMYRRKSQTHCRPKKADNQHRVQISSRFICSKMGKSALCGRFHVTLCRDFILLFSDTLLPFKTTEHLQISMTHMLKILQPFPPPVPVKGGRLVGSSTSTGSAGACLQVDQQLWVLCSDIPDLNNLRARAGLFQVGNFQPRFHLPLLLGFPLFPFIVAALLI